MGPKAGGQFKCWLIKRLQEREQRARKTHVRKKQKKSNEDTPWESFDERREANAHICNVYDRADTNSLKVYCMDVSVYLHIAMSMLREKGPGNVSDVTKYILAQLSPIGDHVHCVILAFDGDSRPPAKAIIDQERSAPPTPLSKIPWTQAVGNMFPNAEQWLAYNREKDFMLHTLKLLTANLIQYVVKSRLQATVIIHYGVNMEGKRVVIVCNPKRDEISMLDITMPEYTELSFSMFYRKYVSMEDAGGGVGFGVDDDDDDDDDDELMKEGSEVEDDEEEMTDDDDEDKVIPDVVRDARDEYNSPVQMITVGEADNFLEWYTRMFARVAHGAVVRVSDSTDADYMIYSFATLAYHTLLRKQQPHLILLMKWKTKESGLDGSYHVVDMNKVLSIVAPTEFLRMLFVILLRGLDFVPPIGDGTLYVPGQYPLDARKQPKCRILGRELIDDTYEFLTQNYPMAIRWGLQSGGRMALYVHDDIVSLSIMRCVRCLKKEMEPVVRSMVRGIEWSLDMMANPGKGSFIYNYASVNSEGLPIWGYVEMDRSGVVRRTTKIAIKKFQTRISHV